MQIFSAPWVVPVDSPVLRDGSIVIDDDRIVAVGSRKEIVRLYSSLPETMLSCVLLPGLVNAHMHLELSYLKASVKPEPVRSFTDWIEELITRRTDQVCSRKEILAFIMAALSEQHSSGVALIGDIGNISFEEIDLCKSELQPKVVRMVEFLGPNRKGCQDAIHNISELDENVAATGHAPYSTPPKLLKILKKRSQQLGGIFSIHAAESECEKTFIQDGGGEFRDFLEKRGGWDGLFSFEEKGFPGTIEYFDHLGLLDEYTLLVHCVHVSRAELQLIKNRGSHICLCPGSNRFLAVGVAPLETMMELKILPGLGTDSLTSNQRLNIWSEMQLLATTHPDIEPAAILSMATLGGAEALRCEQDYGSFAVGKKAELLHIYSGQLMRCNDAKQLVKVLVSGGMPNDISWVSTVHESTTGK